MKLLEGGDCYEAAAKYVLDHPDMTLVHGEPFLQRDPYERFGHAWVEIDGLMAIDVANGKHVELPVLAYYLLGKINADDCKRYSAQEVRRKILETEHWGPWE